MTTLTTPDPQRLQTLLIGLLIIVLISGGWIWSYYQGRVARELELEVLSTHRRLVEAEERLVAANEKTQNRIDALGARIAAELVSHCEP